MSEQLRQTNGIYHSMKTIREWAELLPELIKIELIKETEKNQSADDLHYNMSIALKSFYWDKSDLGVDFWNGVIENRDEEPNSADYLDETPYTSQEVDAMILNYSNN